MNPLGIIAVFAAVVAGVMLVRYLIRRPALDLGEKLRLLFGLGVFPAIAAGSSTVVGMEATTHRPFCGSCHVMGAHFEDAGDPNSQSLAARHSRNPFFGEKSCYVCHADYGMYGYAMTKAGGMGHVYEYYIGGYRKMSLEDAKQKIHLKKPYDNTNCRQCHTTSLQDWRRVPDHESLKAEVDSNKVSCASSGCHGYAHSFNKPLTAAEQKAAAKPPASAPVGSVKPEGKP